jgi:hypothetical protein
MRKQQIRKQNKLARQMRKVQEVRKRGDEEDVVWKMRNAAP